jgi:predicted secreted protein
MATGTLNGTDLVLKFYKNPLGYVDVGYATNFTLDVEADAVDRTTKDSQGWKDIFLGARNWSISCDALYQNDTNPFNNYFVDAFTKLDADNYVQIEFSVVNANAGDNNVKYRGRARIISLNLKGETEAGAEYQIFLQGQHIITESEY